MPTIEISEYALNLIDSERMNENDTQDKVIRRIFAELEIKDTELFALRKALMIEKLIRQEKKPDLGVLGKNGNK